MYSELKYFQADNLVIGDYHIVDLISGPAKVQLAYRPTSIYDRKNKDFDYWLYFTIGKEYHAADDYGEAWAKRYGADGVQRAAAAQAAFETLKFLINYTRKCKGIVVK